MIINRIEEVYKKIIYIYKEVIHDVASDCIHHQHPRACAEEVKRPHPDPTEYRNRQDDEWRSNLVLTIKDAGVVQARRGGVAEDASEGEEEDVVDVGKVAAQPIVGNL